MIGVLQTLWIFLILALMVVRFKVGLSLYLAYIILVPYMSISFGGILLQWNFINMIVLLMAIYEFKIKRTNFKIDFKPLLPFLIYFCISLIMMPFQNGVPIGIQFDTWRMQLMKYMILSFALWNEMRLDASSVKLYSINLYRYISMLWSFPYYNSWRKSLHYAPVYYQRFRI